MEGLEVLGLLEMGSPSLFSSNRDTTLKLAHFLHNLNYSVRRWCPMVKPTESFLNKLTLLVISGFTCCLLILRIFSSGSK
jgi:hypothetical protein